MTPTLVELQQRVAKAIERVIWPLAEWDGDPLNASSAAGKAAVAALEASGLLERERRAIEAFQFADQLVCNAIKWNGYYVGEGVLERLVEARAALTGEGESTAP